MRYSAFLTRLLAAPAPNSGACLPGAVGEVIGDIAGELGLSLSTDPRIRATGNLAVEIGAESVAADHVDHRAHGPAVIPRFESVGSHAGIRSARYGSRIRGIAVAQSLSVIQVGRVEIVGEGKLQFGEVDGVQQIRFDVESGSLSWGDTVLMAAEPRLSEGRIIGTGLDNASGVLLGLLSAHDA